MRSAISAVSLASIALTHGQVPAFPGAEGYGAYAAGGRGGDVYHVTNLNASGAGSFFEAISTVPAAGRTIVFDVSGYIRLPSGSDGTRITSSKITIAGQTAPGDGIGFYNNFLRISGDDIVLRHLRFRRGKTESSGDCIDLDSGSNNSMLDHLSVQFSTDENISSFGSPPENLTLQYSLNSWGLESHSCGGLWDQNHASSHHNLWSHNHTRNPKARPNGLLEWVNNVTFDWDIGFIMGDSQSNQNWKSNVINNYFIGPPGNTHSKALVKALVGTNGRPNFTIHLSGNLIDVDGDGLLNGVDNGYGIAEGTGYPAGTSGLTPGARAYYQSSSAIPGSSAGITTDPARLAYKKVASNAGALRMDSAHGGGIRDEVDTILIGKLLTQTPFHVSRPSNTGASNDGFGFLNSDLPLTDSDQDGTPDLYETAVGWNPGADDHNTVFPGSAISSGLTFFPATTPAGYTYLEEYLHFKASPHTYVAKRTASGPSSAGIDLGRYTTGFTQSPVFTVSNVAGGSVSQSGTGGKLVTFTPTLNYSGRAGFDFTVTDGDGDSWTQRFHLIVTAAGIPKNLRWKGNGTTNVWDTTSTNWWQGTAVTTFDVGDTVTFDDEGSNNPAVAVNSNVFPGSINVNASQNYTFSGGGSISGAAPLLKSGSGSLTIAIPNNSYSGAVGVNGSALIVGQGGNLGSGSVTLGGGAELTNGYSANNTFYMGNPLVVPAGETATVNYGNRCSLQGGLTGGGTLNLNIQSAVTRNDFTGYAGAFGGTVNLLGSGAMRGVANGGSFTGFNNARVTMDAPVAIGFRDNSGGNNFYFGALSGNNSGAALFKEYAGAPTVNIGSLNLDTIFAGKFQSDIILNKDGAGTLTLTGDSTHTGATTVKGGALFVNGSFASSSVTANGGTTLGGGGGIGGLVTATSGSSISPGQAPGQTGVLTVGSGLSLNGGSTVDLDLGNSIAGPNDKITVTAGSLTLASPVTFNVRMVDGTLASGTYYLIDGNATQVGAGITMNLVGMPSNTRQTYGLNRQANGASPAYVVLNVGGSPPATLTWVGTNNGGVWDLNSTGNFSGGPTATFFNLDSVVFDDSSTVGTVVMNGSLEPLTVTVANSAAKPYVFDGAGGIGGNATLSKSGGGTLTINNANSFTGGSFIGAGSEIVLGNSIANASGLGSGAITFNGGTLTMAGFNGSNSISYDPMPNDLIVPTGQTGTLNLTQRAPKPGSANIFPAIYGALSGGGTLNLVTKFVRGDVLGDWSAFTGTLNIVPGDGDGGDFRFGTSYSWPGMPSALVHLHANTSAYYVGTLASGAGTTIEIGALSGAAGSYFRGGPTSGRALTYRIGGRGTDATFAGTIGEQNPAEHTTAIIKAGAGTWTLSGNSYWNGGTFVEQGALEVSGSIENAGATSVSSGAALKLTGGTVTTDSVVVEAGASLNGSGTLHADLNAAGVLETRGFASGTPGALTVDGSVFFGDGSLTRMRGGASSDMLAVTGDISLAGSIQISLAPETAFGRYPLMSCQGEISGTATLTGIPGGTTAHLSTTVPGRVDLVIDDSDEDGLADSWENAYLGGLGSGPDDDDDGDGQSNAVEQRTGTLPNSGASMFAAEIEPASGGQFLLSWPSVPGNTYRIEAASSPGGSWSTVETVAADAEPATTTSKTVAPSGDLRFFRVALDL